MRVPGIGPTWAKRLVEVRRKAHIRDFRDLARLAAFANRRRAGSRCAANAWGRNPVLATQLSLGLQHRGKRRVHPSRNMLPPCSFR